MCVIIIMEIGEVQSGVRSAYRWAEALPVQFAGCEAVCWHTMMVPAAVHNDDLRYIP